jgi:hypothetical protein
MDEMLVRVDKTYIASIFSNVTRFLSEHELDILIRLTDYLGLAEVLKMLESVKEPWADKCRLCRKRKLYDLHTRLENEQVPPGHYEVVGVMPLYDKAQKWVADDEKGFHFNTETGTCYWEREIVDLVCICDNCLQDVFAAASCCSRFDHLYHFKPAQRKAVLTEQRGKERRTAGLFAKIFITSIWRRCKEFSIRSIRTARHGLRLEADERLRLETVEKLRVAKEKAEADRRALLAGAMSVDNKWKAEDHRADKIFLQRKMDYIDLKTHVGFHRGNPAPPQREHQHSWRLRHVDKKNLPVTEEAASARFGLGTITTEEDIQQLTEWKTETVLNYEAWQQDQRRIQQENRFAKHIHCDELKQYVDSRLKQLTRAYQRFQLTVECMEENRIAQREAERNQRRNMRIAGYEAYERECMYLEDQLSHQRRFFEEEMCRIQRERQDMLHCYVEQCSKEDRFWGLDDALRKKLAQEAQERALWEAKVAMLRDTCIRVKVTRPFEDEVRKKVFRDKITGKVIK